jgi:two-component system NtrC family sensor kinase
VVWVADESARFAQSTIDALGSHICVLDGNGAIVAVNKAWRYFAEADRSPEVTEDRWLEKGQTAVYEGANYLAVCDHAAGEGAQQAKDFDGIRRVLRVRIPAKLNADSEGNANGIPGRRRTVFGA